MSVKFKRRLKWEIKECHVKTVGLNTTHYKPGCTGESLEPS